jgi:hypothetical protein
MLNECAILLGKTTEEQAAEQNAFLDAYTVHLRNLCGFLGYGSDKQDDILASDYVDRWERPEDDKLCGRGDETGKTRYRVAKEIVHLTYARTGISQIKKQWKIDRFTQEMNKMMVRFYDQVDSKNLSGKCSCILKRIKEEL